MVDHGWIDEADVPRQFTFANPARFYTGHEPVVLQGHGRRRPPSTRSSPRAEATDARSPAAGRHGRRRHGRARRRRRRRHPATVASSRSAQIDEPADAPSTPTGLVVVPGLRRHPHPLRRAGAVGPDREPVAAARRHHRHRRQLRLLDRAARAGRRRLRDADDGARRGHAARGAGGRSGVGLARPSASTSTGSTGRLGVNAGFLVGHSTMRRAVMGDAGRQRARDAEARSTAMAQLAGRVAGRGRARLLVVARRGPHRRRRPAGAVARAATFEEFVALAAVVARPRGHHARVHPVDRRDLRRSAWSSWPTCRWRPNRPLNWNLLGSLSPTEIYEQQLASSDVAAEQRRHVVALALPDLMRMRASAMLESCRAGRGRRDARGRRRAAPSPIRRRGTSCRAGAGEGGRAGHPCRSSGTT